MCNCIKEVEKKTSEFLKNKIGDKIGTIISEEFESKSMLIDDGKWILSLPFRLEYYRKKKDGTSETKVLTHTVNIMPTYCPFCGVKLKPD
jgi:hypothetical protein